MSDTRTAATFSPPVMEARRWLDGVTHPTDRPLINVSQAAPVDPPPLVMRQAMADWVVNDDTTHLYGPVLGLDELRSEVAAQCHQRTMAHYNPTMWRSLQAATKRLPPRSQPCAQKATRSSSLSPTISTTECGSIWQA